MSKDDLSGKYILPKKIYGVDIESLILLKKISDSSGYKTVDDFIKYLALTRNIYYQEKTIYGQYKKAIESHKTAMAEADKFLRMMQDEWRKRK